MLNVSDTYVVDVDISESESIINVIHYNGLIPKIVATITGEEVIKIYEKLRNGELS